MRDAIIAVKDAAIAERKTVDAQYEVAHRAFLDMTSAKDSVVTEMTRSRRTRHIYSARAVPVATMNPMSSTLEAARREQERAVAQCDEAQVRCRARSQRRMS